MIQTSAVAENQSCREQSRTSARGATGNPLTTRTLPFQISKKDHIELLRNATAAT
jgi:hypothetical protein